MRANGNEAGDPRGQSLQAWLIAGGYDPARIAVERNGRIVRRADFAATALSDSDVLEIVGFVGGGRCCTSRSTADRWTPNCGRSAN